MSTKASPTTSSTGTASTNSTTTAGVVKIKSELPSDEIKEFAENTMNELLGWYGFDGVDRLDLSAKTSRLLQSAANTNPLNNQLEKRRSRNRASTLLQLQQQNLRSINNNNNNNNNNTSRNNNNNNNNINHNNKNKSSNNTNSFRGHSIGASNESTSDHDTRSSREEDSKSPQSAGKAIIDEKIDFNNCCWCRRPVPENAPEFLTTTDGPRYCSESCFTQSRRASFKKAKTCDWCKHVRHAVSYVDFQDGASQLQFCSDKCLNQYKMQIFCKETQAHLDMNPHLREQGLEAAASGNSAGLITPDLWLRNCRSRSASPASTLSVSPGPTASTVALSTTTTASKAIISPPPPLSQAPATNTASSVHKPMISVAPASKLMSKNPAILSNRQSPKHSRKKRILKSCMGSEQVNVGMKSNHNSVRREVGSLSAAGASQLLGNANLLLGVNKSNSLRTSPGHNASTRVSPGPKMSTSSLSQFVASSVQDLHMSVPPLSPMLDQQQQLQHSHSTLSHANVSGRGTNMPPSFFAAPPSGQHHSQQPPPPQFPTRPPFLQNSVLGGGLPRFMGSASFPHFAHTMQSDMTGFPGLLGATPPVTIMVPYPIIIPLPIPIPIPLPIIDFYKAHLTAEQREKLKKEEMESRTEVSQKQENDIDECIQVDSNCNTTEEPLDFTKSKDISAIQHENTTSTNSLDVENFDSATPNQMIDQDTSSLERLDPLSSTVPEEYAVLEKTVEEITHCIVPSLTEKMPENDTVDINVGNGEPETPNSNNQTELENEDAKEKLPKFKITRLHTKRTLIQTKESECSRPLRKRKRIIDCDFQKIALTKDGDDEALDNHGATLMSNATCNSQTKVSSRK